MARKLYDLVAYGGDLVGEIFESCGVKTSKHTRIGLRGIQRLFNLCVFNV